MNVTFTRPARDFVSTRHTRDDFVDDTVQLVNHSATNGDVGQPTMKRSQVPTSRRAVSPDELTMQQPRSVTIQKSVVGV